MTKRYPPCVLPSELLMKILAMLPISGHAMAKQISPRYNKFIVEGNVFRIRADEKVKETCVYVSLRSSTKTEWYVLAQKATKNEYVLRSVNLPLMDDNGKLVIAAGNRLFFLGGATTNVIAFDCAKQTQETYKLKSVHKDPKIAVVANKLCVFGGCSHDDVNYVESFDLIRHMWETLPVPEEDRNEIPTNCSVVVMNDRVYFIHKHVCVVFDPKIGRIQRKDDHSFGDHVMYHTSCVIEQKLFAFDSVARITVYDSVARAWTLVKGLESLPPCCLFSSALREFNGKLMVLQETQKDISMMVIALEDKGLEIWGRLESSNSMTLHEPARIQDITSVEI